MRIKRFSRFGTFVVFLLLFSLLLPTSVNAYTVSDVWGTASEGSGLILNTPVALGRDSNSNIYIADMANHRIVKIDSSGNVLQKFGSLGTGNGQFDTPFGVAVDLQGNILVADTANHRIQKFDSNFNFIRSWGSKGSGDGQFELAREIGIDSQNRYHVVDEFNDRIQVFDEDGVFLYSYGSRGTGNGQFRLPQGIAIRRSASGDMVYICDTYNNRVQVLDVDGNYITQLGTGIQGDSGTQFYHPRGVNIDPYNNDVYIADTYNHKIKKFDSNHVYQWSTDIGISRLEPVFPCQVMPQGDGQHFFVSDTGNSQILKYRGYSSYASVVARIGTVRKATGVFAEPVGAAVDSDGNIYISDTFNHRIQKFSSDGTVIDKWGYGSGAGGPDAYGIMYWQFTAPKQIWYDKKWDDILIADTGNNRIQVFQPNGTWFTNFGYYDLLLPMGVTTTSDGKIYVSDTGHNRVVVFSTLGNYLFSFGSEGTGDGQFRSPAYIVADSQDNIYVADWRNSRIQKFDKNGNFITKWGTNGGVPNLDPLDNWGLADGDLFFPIGLGVDSDDNIWVADSSNNRIQKFTSDGVFIEKIGIFSGSTGNFFSPQGICVADDGTLYVTDGLLNRVIKFTP